MTARGGDHQLLRPVDPDRDHIRGRGEGRDGVTVLIYGDYLCPYCRRLRHVLDRLRQAMGDRLAYVFRHFPNERANPGSEFASRAAEAADRQGAFWPMHDAIYAHAPPLTQAHILEIARSLGLDMERFKLDLDRDDVRERVEEDLADGRRNGVTGTPTIFVDGLRYDGAWDFYSMLEGLEQPVATRLQRTARVFANLPASAGLVLLVAAAAALLCANSDLAPYYERFIAAPIGVGGLNTSVTMSVREWFSEGLLAVFFLLVGLDIRREMTAGALTDRRAALLPALAAIGGVVTPAVIYLAVNPGQTAAGWSVPTATDIAFTLGILALMGRRVPAGLRVFVAALAVVDDILSMLILAVFYPRAFEAGWLLASAVAIAAMFALNRWRVYAGWPYLVVTAGLWLSLHAAGIHAALAGVFLAAFLPTRPAPAAGPLLAQAATALAALEHAETVARERGQAGVEQEPVWDWASRNLSAASDRLLSPAERVERAVAPWSAYVVLPLFAFSATGVALELDLREPQAVHVLIGVILGLVLGKPLGVAAASWLAVKTRVAIFPEDVPWRAFLGAAALCGVGDTVALLMADQAFPMGPDAAAAKIGVFAGSTMAAALGALILATSPPSITPAPIASAR